MKIVLPKDGKIIIPEKIQRELGLQPGDTLEFIVKKQDLVIRRAILWHYDGLILLAVVVAVLLYLMPNDMPNTPNAPNTAELAQAQQRTGSRALPHKNLDFTSPQNFLPQHKVPQSRLPPVQAPANIERNTKRQRIQWTPPSQRTKPLYHTAPPPLEFKHRRNPPIFVKHETNTTQKASSKSANEPRNEPRKGTRKGTRKVTTQATAKETSSEPASVPKAPQAPE